MESPKICRFKKHDLGKHRFRIKKAIEKRISLEEHALSDKTFYSFSCFFSSGLRFVLAPGKSMLTDLFIPKDTTLEEYEVCPDAGVIMEKMSTNLNNHGGSSLIIDYGYDHASGNSLRVRKLELF